MAVHWGGRGPGHVSRASSIGFSPLSLFTASEQGVWYDPSDLSTMFQDTAGTVPVTAAGQSVGLVLDKSQGLALGSELVTNGTFDTNTTGWSPFSSATLSAVSGRLQVVTTGFAGADQTVAVSSAVSFVRFDFDVQAGAAEIVVQVYNAGLDVLLFNANIAATLSSTQSVVMDKKSYSSVRILIRADVSTFTLDNISVRELPGNHATQSNASQRPVLRQNGSLYYLKFDGTDDFLVTGTITPGVDKAQVFAGVRVNAALGMIVETSADATANAGAFYLYNNEPSTRYDFLARGSLGGGNSTSNRTAPETAVITGQAEIASDTNTIRKNGVAGVPSTTDQGTGNFLAYPMYIGRRGGTSLPFNGDIYSMIVRFGSNLPAGTITQTETYMAAKTGVTL